MSAPTDSVTARDVEKALDLVGLVLGIERLQAEHAEVMRLAAEAEAPSLEHWERLLDVALRTRSYCATSLATVRRYRADAACADVRNELDNAEQEFLGCIEGIDSELAEIGLAPS